MCSAAEFIAVLKIPLIKTENFWLGLKQFRSRIAKCLTAQSLTNNLGVGIPRGLNGILAN